MEERRSRTRVPLMFGAVVSSGGHDVPVRMKNLSLKGMSCSPDPRLEEGEPCTVTIGLSDDATIRVKGTVVREGQRDAGVEFEEMDPASFTHLRNLIRFHAEDPDAIDDEVSPCAYFE
ncbi:PilZ domain-containing protein [Desulfohalovibrio reitneri]|uniref:PilZ domain-containing protein n=1 Tax=Desulfohalovibrio reitneri TaxID=1307759 RepID=UPI0004A76643|nr:PilZ domain-containing protein [Desulfohalovibrio reitneri]